VPLKPFDDSTGSAALRSYAAAYAQGEPNSQNAFTDRQASRATDGQGIVEVTSVDDSTPDRASSPNPCQPSRSPAAALGHTFCSKDTTLSSVPMLEGR
jgi:hypothetical protein